MKNSLFAIVFTLVLAGLAMWFGYQKGAAERPINDPDPRAEIVAPPNEIPDKPISMEIISSIESGAGDFGSGAPPGTGSCYAGFQSERK